jgi:hypothetical protein
MAWRSAGAEDDVLRPFAVRVQKQQDESHQHQRIDKRESDNVANAQPAGLVERTVPERRQRSPDGQLGGEVRAEEHLKEGYDTTDEALAARRVRQHAPKRTPSIDRSELDRASPQKCQHLAIALN